MTEAQIAECHEALLADEEVLQALATRRGWTLDTIKRFQVGWTTDRRGKRRVTIPVRDANGHLVDVLLYGSTLRPKLLATAGGTRQLFPHPEASPGPIIGVVEGEPDALAGWSLDFMPFVGIPGVGKSDPTWARRIAAGREEVWVCLDADKKGWPKGEALAREISRQGVIVKLLDLGGDCDLTDVLVEHGHAETKARLKRLADEAEPIRPFRLRPVSAQRFAGDVPAPDLGDDFLGPFLRRGQRVIVGGAIGEGKTTLCMQAVASAAYGEPFLGWRGRGDVRCLVLDLEQGKGSVARRLNETGLAARNDNVFIVNLPGGLAIGRNSEHAEAIEHEIAEGQWDLVVIDPAYALRESEPREEHEAAELARFLDRLRMEYGVCLLIPMHCRKPQERSKLSKHDLYGFSTFARNAEILCGLQLVGHGKSALYWWKDRDGDLGVPLNGHWDLTYSRENLFQREDGLIPGQEAIAA